MTDPSTIRLNTQPVSRRTMLQNTLLGFGGIALTDLLLRKGKLIAADQGPSANKQNSNALNPLAPKPPHFTPSAKRIIYIFLDGGISQLDTWDYKPQLQRDDGKPLPASIAKPKFTFAPTGHLLKSPFKFKQYGQTGMWASDLFPHVNELIDDLCFVHSLHHKQEDHLTAKKIIFTGSGQETRPPLGSWVGYGLGSESENLPAYIDILPGPPRSRSAAFLPGHFASMGIGKPSAQHRRRTLENLGNTTAAKREQLDLIQTINRQKLQNLGGIDGPLESDIQNMELAFRMQTQAPDLIALTGESKATKQMYGIGDPGTTDFGRALLMARRFSERGVRQITVFHATTNFGNLWDQHANLEKGHRGNARAVDKPIAGFLRDMKARGLLEDTLVMCGSEFGRTPVFEFMNGGMGQRRDGRDHNPHGFTMWFAGGGFKPATRYGATDDYGYHAIENPVSIYDMHATILHAMGIDHQKLTYKHAGRDYRLTDVYGEPIKDLLVGM